MVCESKFLWLILHALDEPESWNPYYTLKITAVFFARTVYDLWGGILWARRFYIAETAPFMVPVASGEGPPLRGKSSSPPIASTGLDRLP